VNQYEDQPLIRVNISRSCYCWRQLFRTQ